MTMIENMLSMRVTLAQIQYDVPSITNILLFLFIIYLHYCYIIFLSLFPTGPLSLSTYLNSSLSPTTRLSFFLTATVAF